MFWLSDDTKPWFRPKMFGFGAGLPIAWQGWMMLAFHVALIAGLAFLLRDHEAAMVAAIFAAAVVPLPIYVARTKGGWRWRRGEDK